VYDNVLSLIACGSTEVLGGGVAGAEAGGVATSSSALFLHPAIAARLMTATRLKCVNFETCIALSCFFIFALQLQKPCKRTEGSKALTSNYLNISKCFWQYNIPQEWIRGPPKNRNQKCW
jgi:hypothetical protein